MTGSTSTARLAPEPVGDELAALVEREQPSVAGEQGRDLAAARMLARDERAGPAIEEVQISFEIADRDRAVQRRRLSCRTRWEPRSPAVSEHL